MKTPEEHRADIRAAGYLPNPYRLGLWQGREYIAVFKAWSAEAKARGKYDGRPEPPPCPYDNRVSVRQWTAGYRREIHAPR